MQLPQSDNFPYAPVPTQTSSLSVHPPSMNLRSMDVAWEISNALINYFGLLNIRENLTMYTRCEEKGAKHFAVKLPNSCNPCMTVTPMSIPQHSLRAIMHASRLAACRFVPPACARLAAKSPFSWLLTFPWPNPARTSKTTRAVTRHPSCCCWCCPKAPFSHADQTIPSSASQVAGPRSIDVIAADPITQTVCNFAQAKIGGRDPKLRFRHHQSRGMVSSRCCSLLCAPAPEILSQDTGPAVEPTHLSRGQRSRHDFVFFLFHEHGTTFVDFPPDRIDVP